MKTNFLPILQRSWVAAGVGVATLAYGVVKDSNAKKQAKEMAKSRPKTSPSTEIGQNLSLQASELANTNDEASRELKEATDSQLATSLGASLKSGGTPNDVASIFSDSAKGRYNLVQLAEQLRQSRIANLSGAYEQTASDKNRVFDYNSREWYDDATANAMEQQQAANLIGTGISTVGSSVSGYLSNKQVENTNAKTLADQDKLYKEQEATFMNQMQQYFNPQITNTTQIDGR